MTSVTYALLEESRNNAAINIDDITNRFYPLTPNRTGILSVDFSFALKLAHTVNNGLRLYDNMVSVFYFCPDIQLRWQKKRQIQAYLTRYPFLRDEYDRIIKNNLLAVVMASFRQRFAVGAAYSEIKLIDTLLGDTPHY